MQIKISAFGGEIPRVNKRLLPDTQAQVATNVNLLAGSVKTVNADLLLDTVDLAPNTQSIYNYNWNVVDNWLQWIPDVDVVKSPIVGDLYNRIYYTGTGAPRIRFVNVRENNKYYIGNALIRWSKTDGKIFQSNALSYSIRNSNTLYPLGTQVQWSNSSNTLWQVTIAGTTAGTAPSIVGKNIGDTVADGGVTWKRIAITPTSKFSGTPGRTATTPPDISAILVGQEILDGSVIWIRLPDASTPIRENSHSYNLNQSVKWSTGSTYWKCIVAGTTASTPPDITGVEVSFAITDGSVVWVRIPGVDTPEQDYKLGVPKPLSKPVVTAVDKTTTSWTPNWTGWWEEPDGTKKGEHTFPYNPVVGGPTYYPPNTVIAGTTYVLAASNIFPKPTGTSDAAKFVLMMQASSSSGKLLGRVFPDISFFAASSDLYINGAKVSATETLVTTVLTNITFTLSYDTTATSEYISDRAYVYTYVDGLGEEGPPSEPSDIVAIDPNKDAQITGMDQGSVTPIDTAYIPIYRIRIYRTVTSSAGTNYQFVKEIDIRPTGWNQWRAFIAGEVTISYSGTFQALVANTNAQPEANPTKWLKLENNAQFQDNITDAEVGEVIPSIGWDPPGANYSGIVYIPGGFFACFDDKSVYFSEPNQPHAWPVKYGITIEDKIIGLGVAENTLAVLTEKFPYLATVQSPDQAYISKLSAPQSCVAKRSIIENGGAIIYASQDGICLIANASVLVTSLGLFSKDQWFSYRYTGVGDILDDTKTQLFVNDQYIYVNTLNRTFRFRIGDSQISIVELSDHFYGFYDDRVKDDLYIIKQTHDFGKRLFKLGEDTSSYMQAIWQSKEFVLPLPQKWMIGRITSSSYPINFQVFTDGITTPLANISVTDNKAFRLPYLGRYKFWSVKVVVPYSTTETEITEILLSTNFSDL